MTSHHKPQLSCSQSYGVPPNTPTEFMVQFFASLERKGLLRRTKSNDTLEISETEENVHVPGADDRKLKPRPVASPDPRELLLKDIRSRPKLRPIRDGKLVVVASRSRLNSDTDQQTSPPEKRVIKPDFKLLLNNSLEESTDDEDQLKCLSVASSPMSDLSFVSDSMTPPSPHWHRARHIFSVGRTTKPQRRHTITVCQSVNDGKKHWQNHIECLSLSLEEVTHIRTVLTKAELESLATTPELYHQVSKSKVCFTCKFTRFTLFGEWGTRCKLCQRTVCGKCIRKMNVPTDHFRNVPVYTLNPSPMTLEMQEFVQKIVRTAPPPSVPQTRASSPNRSFTLMAQLQNHHKEQSSMSVEPLMVDNLNNSRTGFSQSKSLFREQSHFDPFKNQRSGTPTTFKGQMMAICCGCRKMVTEIIRAHRASSALLTSSSSPATVSASKFQHLPEYLSIK